MIDIKRLKNALPENPDILERQEYFNSSILILLVYLDAEYHFILQKRKQEIRQGGEISFPGGGYDPKLDKNHLDTAIRETCEEIGICKSQIEILGNMGKLLSPLGVIIDAFVGLARIDSISELSPSEDEVEEIITIPVSYFINNQPEVYFVEVFAKSYKLNEQGKKTRLLPVKKLGLPDIYMDSWGSYKYKVYLYNNSKSVIWGITAKFIYNFINDYADLIQEN